MFSLFKKNPGKQPVPAWASFFNEKEYGEFLKAVDSYFKEKKISYELENGVLQAGPNEYGLGTLGLTNVAQVCKQAAGSYKNIVREHFDTMVRSYQFETKFNKIVHDYDQIKHYIGVRLYPSDYAEQKEDMVMGKDFAEGIYAMLVFDLPDSVMNIHPEQAEKWGRSFDELFSTGIKNIRDKYPPEINEENFGDFKLRMVHGDHFYAPNIVFELDKQDQLIGTYGSLIAIPHRHAVLIYPIENLGVIKALHGLLPIIHGMYEEGPGSISARLFWYKDGHYEHLYYNIDDKNVQFYPPDVFIELLNRLEK